LSVKTTAATHQPSKIISTHSTSSQISQFSSDPIQCAFLPYISRQAAPALWCTIGFNTQHQTSNSAKNVGSVQHRGKTNFELMLTATIYLFSLQKLVSQLRCGCLVVSEQPVV